MPRVAVLPVVNFHSWRKPYTFLDLAKAFEKACESNNEVIFTGIEIDFYNFNDTVFNIEVEITDEATPLNQYIEIVINSFKNAHLLATETLAHSFSSEGITTLFQFPPEIKSTCNQYLIYFAQFLEDLGISADTTLKEEANRVLFTITPKDRDQALDVIYEALAAYLNAPSENLENSFGNNDIALYQLKANIHHLKGQLELSKALIQAKDATIESLQLSNYQLQSLLLSNKQLEDKPYGESKDEKVLGGIIAIKKYEGKGFSIDLAEIFRRLKRKII